MATQIEAKVSPDSAPLANPAKHQTGMGIREEPINESDPNDPTERPNIGRLNNHRTLVDVSFWVANVISVEDAKSCFTCDFWVGLEWKDERLARVGLEQFARMSTTDVWHPAVGIKNATGAISTIASLFVPASKDSVFTVSMLTRYNCSLYGHFDLRTFPFDVQRLSIEVDDLTGVCHLTCQPKSTGYESFLRTELSEPEWNPEWIFLKVPSIELQTFTYRILGEVAEFEEGFDRVTLGVIAKRRRGFFVFKYCVLLLSIVALNVTNFLVDPADINDKIASVFTLFLTVVAFDWLSAGMVPKLGYTTSLDRCCTCVYLLLIITLVFALNDKYAYYRSPGKWDPAVPNRASIVQAAACSVTTLVAVSAICARAVLISRTRALGLQTTPDVDTILPQDEVARSVAEQILKLGLKPFVYDRIKY